MMWGVHAEISRDKWKASLLEDCLLDIIYTHRLISSISAIGYIIFYVDKSWKELLSYMTFKCGNW